MSPQFVASIVASLGLAAISPAMAGASQTAFGSAPVALSACSTNTVLTSASPYETPRFTTGLRYRFTNNTAVPAQAVTVDVTFDGRSSQVVNHGTFSPGANIDVSDADATTSLTSAVSCRVTEVDFRDGTSWHAAGAANVSVR